MKHLLLLGAGFSHNWGGWLPAEAFEYLLGCTQIDADLHGLLLRHRRADGFQGALGELQTEFFRSMDSASRERLEKLQDATAQMFAAMDEGFAATQFEFQTDVRYLVEGFMARFDPIFTLNQDLLLERHYLSSGALANSGRWKGGQILAVRPQNPDITHLQTRAGYDNRDIFIADGDLSVHDRLQPYIKLHGSINWRDGNHPWLMVMSANKPSGAAIATPMIDHFPVLGKLRGVFAEYLSSGPVRLMSIGYSFGDEPINDMLVSAGAAGRLKIFIVDPLGLEILDRQRFLSERPLLIQLGPHVIGASRRSLRETFGANHVEHAKLSRFFG